MTIKKERTTEYFLENTSVENLFISEYMVSAPGDYVKVYLCALMYAEAGKSADDAEIARLLGLAPGEVEKAWAYWESMGVVRRHWPDKTDRSVCSVEMLSLKKRLYGSADDADAFGEDEPREEAGAEDEPADEDIRDMFDEIQRKLSRPLTGSEVREILSWIDEGATPECALRAYNYCIDIRGKDNVRYVAALVREWVSKGLTTNELIDGYLNERDKRHAEYRRIFRALGFSSRPPTEAEESCMNYWFDELGCTMPEILDACGKTTAASRPSIKYVHAIIMSNHGGKAKAEAGGSGKIPPATVLRYYDYIRKRAEDAAEERLAEVYAAVPRIKQIDEQIADADRQRTRLMISGGADRHERAEELKKRSSRLAAERAALLEERGYGAGYTDPEYMCPRCRDTGTDRNDERCSCWTERAKEAGEWQNSLGKN